MTIKKILSVYRESYCIFFISNKCYRYPNKKKNNKNVEFIEEIVVVKNLPCLGDIL